MTNALNMTATGNVRMLAREDAGPHVEAHTAALEKRLAGLSSDDLGTLRSCTFLQDFLDRALPFLTDSGNFRHAETVAHFLMGKLPYDALPPQLQISSDDVQGFTHDHMSLLNDVIRTHRYGIFGVEERPEKTIAKLACLRTKLPATRGEDQEAKEKNAAPSAPDVPPSSDRIALTRYNMRLVNQLLLPGKILYTRLIEGLPEGYRRSRTTSDGNCFIHALFHGNNTKNGALYCGDHARKRKTICNAMKLELKNQREAAIPLLLPFLEEVRQARANGSINGAAAMRQIAREQPIQSLLTRYDGLGVDNADWPTLVEPLSKKDFEQIVDQMCDFFAKPGIYMSWDWLPFIAKIENIDIVFHAANKDAMVCRGGNDGRARTEHRIFYDAPNDHFEAVTKDSQ
ncbi:MAG TPA: hypothetical protein VEC06_09080 [Paucimonas sp.]|nr:hypothetical protein [Paucimonas sp.]